LHFVNAPGLVVVVPVQDDVQTPELTEILFEVMVKFSSKCKQSFSNGSHNPIFATAAVAAKEAEGPQNTAAPIAKHHAKTENLLLTFFCLIISSPGSQNFALWCNASAERLHGPNSFV